MKRLIVLIALAASLCGPAAFSQAINRNNVNTPTNLYITSMYKVQVYVNNRVVDELAPGQRARIVRTKGNWIYIEYSRGNKTYEGWIKR